MTANLCTYFQIKMEEQKELEGLEGLGVSVQSQETLENDIIEKLEEKIKVKEQEAVVKQVKKELTSISTKIRENLKRKKHCERQIRSIYKSESSLSSQKTRQISSLLNDQEGFERALTELFASQTANIQRLKESNYDFENDPELKVLIIKQENESVEDAEDEAEEETELQKNIRLGDVTAFGNVLQTRSSNQNDEVNFDNYLQQQIGGDFNAASTSRKRRISRECSDDSDSGFVDVVPEKRKKTEATANKSRIKKTEPQGEDSDWKPESSEEEEEKQEEPLIKKKEAKKSSKPQRRLYDEDEVGWRTDDSDFDGTDDEAETPKRKRTRHGDDGDKDLYLARVTAWQQKRSEDDKSLDGRYEELEGGLRVPSSLWKKLYNYQRVGVQWMFELHQQQVSL